LTLYSVYARNAGAPRVVADRFSWLAALLPPVYALAHGLWLVLLGWVVAVVGFAVLGRWIGEDAATGFYILAAILFGFEAQRLRGTKLVRTGWSYRTDVFAADSDLAAVDYLKQVQ
jgi:hypothetical protein